ncbi:NmrA/HSCARG family protein [Halobaculum sp. MBLA0147]|uniref:NmrA/HSCARG family protein n=1 Tax=Halobaculum sp. MBLA0147 TaxID=3079934 RepID=UPI003526A5AF
MTRTVLVAGATGTQGGSVVDALRAADAPVAVRALTRDPTSREARTLADRGVEVVRGDLTDRESMDAAVDGVDAVFGATAASSGDGERTQGITLADAAAAGDPDQFVFSSGGNADRRPGVPHVDAKHDVERHLADLDLRTTVIRPHSFFQNFERERPGIEEGRLAVPLPPGADHVLVDARDVGRFAARAFAEPERFDGVTVELAGEVTTAEALAETFADVLGQSVAPVHLPLESVGDEQAAFFEFLSTAEADPDRLRREFGFHPRSLRSYLEETGWGERRGPAR